MFQLNVQDQAQVPNDKESKSVILVIQINLTEVYHDRILWLAPLTFYLW